MKLRQALPPLPPTTPTTPTASKLPALDPLLSPQSPLNFADLDALEQSAAAHHEPIPLIVRAVLAVARELRAMRAERG